MRLTSSVRLTGTYASHRSLIGRLILIEGTPPAVGEVPSYLPDRLAHRRQAGVVGGIDAGALEERLLRERGTMRGMLLGEGRDGERGEGRTFRPGGPSTQMPPRPLCLPFAKVAYTKVSWISTSMLVALSVLGGRRMRCV